MDAIREKNTARFGIEAPPLPPKPKVDAKTAIKDARADALKVRRSIHIMRSIYM